MLLRILATMMQSIQNRVGDLEWVASLDNSNNNKNDDYNEEDDDKGDFSPAKSDADVPGMVENPQGSWSRPSFHALLY